MKERPILFGAPMVRAILSGTKTQTRRIFKLPPKCSWYEGLGGESQGWIQDDEGPAWWHIDEQRCPHGQPGDRLWVRESMLFDPDQGWRYDADGADVIDEGYGKSTTRCPSIHMPRSCSRTLLEITGVFVERLQDISVADAIAEGIGSITVSDGGAERWINYAQPESKGGAFGDPRRSYRSLWEQINGLGSWDTNPWVWVIEFKRMEAA